MCKVGEINLSYECLTSPEVRQTLVGLRSADAVLYEQLSVPAPSTPMPPPSPECDGSYPEDQESEDDERPVDSSLSMGEVVAWIANEVPGELVNSSDEEDERIDGFGCEGPCISAGTLELFDPRISTSYWPRWDGRAVGM